MASGVSVIIPTFNRAHTIKRSIESVLRQTYQDFEIIVIDDGSEDDTEKVVSSIGDSRISFFRMPENRGPSAARNEGVRRSRYDYIAFQDSDDEWLPEKLEKQMKVLENASPEVGMVYHLFHMIEKDKIWPQPGEGRESLYRGSVFSLLLFGNAIGTPTMLLRKEYFQAAGGFEEGLACLEDYEFALRFAYQYQIEFINEVLLYVHASENSVNSHMDDSVGVRLFMIKQKMKDCSKIFLRQTGRCSKMDGNG